MNNGQKDERIHKLIKRWTNVDKKLQRQTWKKIDKQLFQKRTTKRKWIIVIATTCLILITLFSSLTETGQAIVREVIETFEVKKQKTIEIEGDKETTDVTLHENDRADFIIYIDENRYKMEQNDDGARIVTKEPLEEHYPDVYMEIYEVNDKTKSDVVAMIKEQLADEKMLIIQEEKVTEPIEAMMIEGMEEDETMGEIRHGWDTAIHKYYIVEASPKKHFVIKQVYFQEAAEGHGARFHYMLESFQIIR